MNENDYCPNCMTKHVVSTEKSEWLPDSVSFKCENCGYHESFNSKYKTYYEIVPTHCHGIQCYDVRFYNIDKNGIKIRDEEYSLIS